MSSLGLLWSGCLVFLVLAFVLLFLCRQRPPSLLCWGPAVLVDLGSLSGLNLGLLLVFLVALLHDWVVLPSLLV